MVDDGLDSVVESVKSCTELRWRLKPAEPVGNKRITEVTLVFVQVEEEKQRSP